MCRNDLIIYEESLLYLCCINGVNIQLDRSQILTL